MYNRTSLILKYEKDLQKKQNELTELEALLPDFDNMLTNQYALKEKKRLMDRKSKLDEEIEQLGDLLADMKNDVDDTTPVA
ncbi:hypothetical protein FUAX_51340 (plasmid) [Fulvitalea axinellae]|uniref:DUF465 domain-containing protein n=1 Tax=Fulvitalea axinellae TaxID=1182444 RepID=A0AAU9CY24_9BACT|nr:hypothetical protein FUAX_51340 [Fulvitalea axinellae]